MFSFASFKLKCLKLKMPCLLAALQLLLYFCSFLGPVEGGKVLVMPVDGSHWLSMKILVEELSQRGHEMVVLVPETSLLIRGSDAYTTRIFKVPFTKDELDDIMKNTQERFMKAPAFSNILENLSGLLRFTDMQVNACEALLYNEPLMQDLRDKHFDLMLTDPFLPCGPIIAEAFSLPVIYFLRGLPCGLDEDAAQCPAPPSYVPRLFVHLTDVMTFPQRVANVLMAGFDGFLCKIFFSSFDELTSRYLKKDISYKEVLEHASIWLHRYDFTFEYPKPVMPNMVTIGGINCAKKKPLPAELEEFVEGSGDHGFIVFTLGSYMSEVPESKAQEFFKAFKQIPQKVLWRYTGPVPKDLPENVKLMKWLPQNDLLAHPKAKVFITHGGSHGTYEGICNGVPMVMIPLFGDQRDNVLRMVSHGVAESLNMYDLTSENLLGAVRRVITDKSYKEKIIKLSVIHKDRPIEPLDLAVFWVEFVMRHGGAAHLRPAAHNLNWVQYHSLDVISFLLLVLTVAVFITLKTCAFCFRKCFRRTQKTKKE
ncbi:UDP-glucuronosyltransferase-like isoform 1-T1 [Clarias gariepinus]|uniref:UDP-glucuronosyltransferase-like n=1 Tax=Clarias gariepinus TaxID=13013 RepID=UPI00234CE948|nr:UDP-glucuronosyltransferase-like [Clarias gariepinus]